MGYRDQSNYKDRPVKISLRASLGGGPLTPGMIAGLLLITGGVLLFIDNLQILPIDIAGIFWPLVLLIYSAAMFYPTKSTPVKVWCTAGMAAGVLLILGKFHIIHATGSIVWPLFLIACGVVLMIYRLQWAEFKGRFNPQRLTIGSNTERGSIDGTKLQEFAIFSSVKRRIEVQGFEGGELTSVFGSIELDLRWANITNAERRVVIEANSVFGSIEIRIPETWKLKMNGTAVFGAYEDKTLPPRPEGGLEPPTLVIRGGTAFGAVTLRN